MGSWPLQKTAGRGPIVNSQLEGTVGGTSIFDVEEVTVRRRIHSERRALTGEYFA